VAATAFDKAWQLDHNRAPSDGASVLALSRSFAWFLKAFLKGEQGGATLGLWTCAGSSDGVAAGMDAVDRWGAPYNGAKLVRAAAGVAHSWIVLRSPVITTAAGAMTFYCTIDFSGAADSTPINLVFSKAAPTGGSITARPTATDEWTHAANTPSTNDNTAGAMRFHGWLSADGACFMFGAGKNGSGQVNTGILFHVLNEARATDLYPVATWANYLTTAPGVFGSANTAGLFGNAGGWRMRFADGSGVSTDTRPVFPSAGGTLLSALFNLDFTDQTLGDFPIYLVNADANKNSMRGRLADVRSCVGAPPAQGQVEPLTGPIASVAIGSLWFPAASVFQL
jgi:hypothetical protein